MRAMQKKHRLFGRSYDVNVRRTMIVRVDDHAQPVDAENNRHCHTIAKPKRLGKVIAAEAPTRALTRGYEAGGDAS